MIKDIKYTGVSTVPPDREAPDGSLTLSLNLVNENGEIQPVPQPAVELSLDPGSSVVFIHKTSGPENYILLKGSSLLSMERGVESASPVDIFPPAISGAGFLSCNAVGNTLIVLTENAMYYLLWQNGKYLYLGDRLPTIDLSFGLVGHPRLYSISDPDRSKFDVNLRDGIHKDNMYDDFSDNNKSWVTEQVMAKLNKFIRQQTVEKGRFCFPFFIRYALRLYDGSLTRHSAPILMLPSTTPAPLVWYDKVQPGPEGKFGDFIGCDIMLMAADIDCRLLSLGDYENVWKDIITSVDIFISRPIYTYDQNGFITNVNDSDNIGSQFVGRPFFLGTQSDPREDCVVGPLSEDSNFMNSYTQWNYGQIYAAYFSKERNRLPYNFHLPEFTEEKQQENITDCSTFYLLHSIPLDSLFKYQTQRLVLPVADDYLQSLTSREVMTDDYLSHDRLIPAMSMEFNSRLNLSQVKRELFSGFAADSQFGYVDSYIKDFDWSDDHTLTVRTVGNGLEVPLEERAGETILTFYVREEGRVIQLPDLHSTMGSWGSLPATDHETGSTFRTPMSWGSYIFYPSTKAFRVKLRCRWGNGVDTDSDSVHYIDLKPHPFLNGSFAFLGFRKERVVTSSDPYDSSGGFHYTGTAPENPSTSLIVSGDNKIYTSEAGNPFFFPLTGINSVGSGRVLGISTAARALSQGQFGQFPLYAFCTDGVWALSTTSTGSYSAVQPITRDVCSDPTGITQIDSSVLFPTSRGIMLISGSQTQCISDSLNTDTPFNLESLPGFDKIFNLAQHDPFSIVPFPEFLDGAKIVYDYVNQRVVVFKPKIPYAYVFSLRSKLWSMIGSDFESVVNSYPDAMVMDSSGRLLNLSRSASDDRGILMKGGKVLLSRPLNLDSPDLLKTVDTVIQRGQFRCGHVQSVIYGSRDLFNWYLVWSSKDHYLRGFRGTPYKYFRLALICNLQPGESISGATVRFNPRLADQPR